jgi:hypothetical protein
MKISDLTVTEFTELISEIIDQRLRILLDSDGKLRENFVDELLERKNNPDLVDMDEVFSN